jgi:hypothetical protein
MPRPRKDRRHPSSGPIDPRRESPRTADSLDDAHPQRLAVCGSRAYARGDQPSYRSAL